ncbi:MAG TPA: DUF3047 domain-containing protein [Candidatus Methylomirabilis sp.]|nr:DUF3047 domain-containing protein [Candidatus Methylomirabilis sp.]
MEDWREQALGHVGIPVGWEGQSRGHADYDFLVEALGSRKVLRLRSHRDNSIIGKRVGKIDVKKFPILEWEWQAVTLPAGGDSRKAATDDQVSQVYVVFPRFPSAVRSRIIGYVWDTTVPAGQIFESPRTAMLTYVVVRSGSADLGRFIVERRNVRADFKRIYGEEPAEEVELVSIGIDSNDTASTAESYMGAIRFRELDELHAPNVKS